MKLLLNAKFEAWMKEKEAKIQAKIQKLAQAGDAAAKLLWKPKLKFVLQKKK